MHSKLEGGKDWDRRATSSFAVFPASLQGWTLMRANHFSIIFARMWINDVALHPQSQQVGGTAAWWPSGGRQHSLLFFSFSFFFYFFLSPRSNENEGENWGEEHRTWNDVREGGQEMARFKDGHESLQVSHRVEGLGVDGVRDQGHRKCPSGKQLVILAFSSLKPAVRLRSSPPCQPHAPSFSLLSVTPGSHVHSWQSQVLAQSLL